MLAFTLAVFGFATFGSIAVADAFLSEFVPVNVLGVVFGFYATANYLSISVLPPVLGQLIDRYGFGVFFSVLSGVTLLSIPPLLMAGNPKSSA
jgi:sugar phosphate permease